MTQVQEQARIDEVERQKSSLEVQAQHALALEKSTLQHQNEVGLVVIFTYLHIYPFIYSYIHIYMYSYTYSHNIHISTLD